MRGGGYMSYVYISLFKQTDPAPLLTHIYTCLCV
jgi:hypothetical protein